MKRMAVYGLFFMTGVALAQPALRVPLPLPKTPGGHIVYARYLAHSAPGQPVFLPKLFVMNADGSGKTTFLAPSGYVSVKEPRWSPTYDRLAFVSDYLPGMSACYEDVFVASAADGSVRRVTGNELRGAPALGYGAITGVVVDNVHQQGAEAPYSAQQIQIAAQGAGPQVYHPQGASTWTYPFTIPRVAAGKIWIKVWVTKHIGCVVTRDVRPGQVTNVGRIKLSAGNYLAKKPSLSRDGQWVVGLGAIASSSVQSAMGNPNYGKSRTNSVAANVCVWRASDGQTAGMFEPMRARGESAKDPALSPTAPIIAAAWGGFGIENLALIPLQSILANQPTPRVLVAGGRQLAQGPFGMPTPLMIGAASPAWSPDGRTIAFCRTVMQGRHMAGQLWLVNADGSGLRQLTRAGANQICCEPCFSPDGTRIAFTVLTAKSGMIDVLYFGDPGRYMTFDIYTINVDGSDVRRLTNDGVSVNPAWGL